MQRIALTALVTLVILLPCHSQEKIKLTEKAVDLDGYYSCDGLDGGKKYSGVVVIQRQGSVFIVQWSLGVTNYVGVGFRTGDDGFAAGWAMNESKPGAPVARGVNSYRIDGKKLIGRWASIPGSGQIGTETLTFLRELPSKEDDQ